VTAWVQSDYTLSTDMAVIEGAFFPERVKLEAKKLAAFRCCMCHTRAGDEVHHITPRAEGGTNDIDNAVLLCAQCHNDNGSRPQRAG
jgi:5-methylcytosine-specific restriction endonuclease McrA